jgi:hypothetical protein
MGTSKKNEELVKGAGASPAPVAAPVPEFVPPPPPGVSSDDNTGGVSADDAGTGVSDDDSGGVGSG